MFFFFALIICMPKIMRARSAKAYMILLMPRWHIRLIKFILIKFGCWDPPNNFQWPSMGWVWITMNNVLLWYHGWNLLVITFKPITQSYTLIWLCIIIVPSKRSTSNGFCCVEGTKKISWSSWPFPYSLSTT